MRMTKRETTWVVICVGLVAVVLTIGGTVANWQAGQDSADTSLSAEDSEALDLGRRMIAATRHQEKMKSIAVKKTREIYPDESTQKIWVTSVDREFVGRIVNIDVTVDGHDITKMRSINAKHVFNEAGKWLWADYYEKNKMILKQDDLLGNTIYD